MSIKSEELRDQFLKFFESKNHRVLPSASLVPKDDSSVLFTSAGMQQFRKFYASPDEALAATITTCQKCIRTSDIDEVGDATHLTFFEMLGNFSFGYPEKEGSYFKKEAIEYAWEFLTEVLKIEKNRLSATYFKGEGDIPADDESLEIIKQVTGLADDKIKGTGKDETFWSLGTEGSPGGPTVEFYIDPSTSLGTGGVEIWNLVFNQYVMKDGKYVPSKYKGVDTGMGLERLAAMMQGKNDVFETDLFEPIIVKIEDSTGKKYHANEEAFRRIADHSRCASELIKEGIKPGKNDREYILRVLLRVSFMEIKHLFEKDRNIEAAKGIEFLNNALDEMFFDYSDIADHIFNYYKNEEISSVVSVEYQAYRGLRKQSGYFIKYKDEPIISGEIIFRGKDTFGLSAEGVVEIWENILGKKVNPNWEEQYSEAESRHKELSRTASAGMFKGGLADAGEQTTKLHTAAHLMLAAMRKVLGPDVNQKGSNITAERLRFDFNYPEKLIESQIKEIEDIVNENIKADLSVAVEEMSVEEAKKSGATGVFDERYGDKVKVYTIGNRDNTVSREICGGPHVEHIGQLGHFKITKEESSSAGIRRVKAILE